MRKKKGNAGLVKDADNWKKMAGDSELEKRPNSYLTSQFVSSRDVPADECLAEAKKIIALCEKHFTGWA